MRRGSNYGHGVGSKGGGLRCHIAWRAPHDDQIGLAALQHAQHAFAVFDMQPDFNIRVQTRKAHQQHRHKILGCAHHRQRNAPLLCARVLGHERFQLVQLGHHHVGAACKRAPRIGKPDAAALRFYQSHAKSLFKLANVHGNGGLRYAQLLGRLGHRALAGNLYKRLNLL